jgi:hypothetical protein
MKFSAVSQNLLLKEVKENGNVIFWNKDTEDLI